MLQEVEAYDNALDKHETVGGRKGIKKTRAKKPKKPRKPRKGKKGSRKTVKRGTKKRGNKKVLSKWVMHVKSFCKKTGKNFPQALKDPLCKRTFRH
tara:strand:+ start:70 stop:357 length:288 start_codon:yes stop_codon:yes gene_type:complete